jgi:nucleoside-diphosphate-sugar epimerase
MIETAFANRNVLITGGAGFIGSNLAARLVGLGARVTVLDNLLPGCGGNLFNLEPIQDRIRIKIMDLRDDRGLEPLVEGQDYLFNLAGRSSHMDSMRDPYGDLDANCRAHLAILEACRIGNPDLRIVFASTRQLYGKPDSLPVSEQHSLRPIDINGIHKLAGEWYHTLYHELYGIHSCTLRLTNTYGPRMRVKDARQTFLGLWIRLVTQNKPFEVWGGEQLRDFTYVDDAVDAFLIAAACDAAKGQIYNLGGDSVVCLKDLAETLITHNRGGNYTICAYPDDRKAIDIGDYYSDFSAIHRDLGWTPKVGLVDGLMQTMDYFRQHLKHYE